MDLFALYLYGISNIAMVLYYLCGKERFFQFPFWAGAFSLGWFFPMAIGGYTNVANYPPNAYCDGLMFASMCTWALWGGFELALRHRSAQRSWLGAAFNGKKLYWSGALLCMVGFFFQLKLWSLPEEMLAQTQWSGATVKYLFFASVFKFGFIVLWILYLSERKIFSQKFLVFIVPCLLLMLIAVVIRGRRGEMMNVVSFVFISLWFVRRITLPKWVVVTCLVAGLIFINAIGTYRKIMKDKERSLSDRLLEAASTDYLDSSGPKTDLSIVEFSNYMHYRQIHADTDVFDLGVYHWNRLVFNYVPAQIFGRAFKESLQLEPSGSDLKYLVEDQYGYTFHTGSTTTGYKDAFGSFGWFGFIKFGFIGVLMGTLYRYAFSGYFLGQLLYVYSMGAAMRSISHTTHLILFATPVYFFLLAYPVIYAARIRRQYVE